MNRIWGFFLLVCVVFCTRNAGAVERKCFHQWFLQPEENCPLKLDLLFVVDSSNSYLLHEARHAIGEGIDGFLHQLEPHTDFRVAVMLGHGSKSAHTGRLWRAGTHPRVLRSDSMSNSTIREHLIANLEAPDQDPFSDGGQEGLYSFSRALDKDHLRQNREHGFFREDAALVVVFVSNENDICAQYPPGVTPVPNPNGVEAMAKARDCGRITPASVLARVKRLQGPRPFLVSGIVYNNLATYPHEGENEYGYGYLDLIALANGTSIDMADAAIERGLGTLGGVAATKIRLMTDFPLVRHHANASTIRVLVDDLPAEFTYDAEVNQVHVAQPGQAEYHIVHELHVMREAAGRGKVQRGHGITRAAQQCQLGRVRMRCARLSYRQEEAILRRVFGRAVVGRL